jgi:galactosylceramidase
MDYLFLPGFGASLQILKVEIGGDVQSTDGTEPSHMHSVDDENYERGYEWVLMVEAKRRNPNITLYGLSWGFPGWVGEGTEHPWTNSTVTYTVKWLLGAKNYYNLDIDYIGIWNEKSWNKDYTLALKAAITTVGLKTKIVGHDASWDVCDDLSKDSEWAAAIDVISAHYPGTEIKPNCCALNKVQWVCCVLLSHGQDSMKSGKSYGRQHIGVSSPNRDGSFFSTERALDYWITAAAMWH